MSEDSNEDAPLPPGDAFAALGHEIRVGIFDVVSAEEHAAN